MNTGHMQNCRAQQQGNSLIEVLVSLVLVAVTMLGLLGLQLRTMGLQKDSFDRRNAATIASAFGERVTANFAGFELAAGGYNALAFKPGDTAPTLPACGVNNCTPAQIVARDWATLVDEVSTRLPGGAAFVETQDATWVRITVGWLDVQRTADMAASASTYAADANCPSALTGAGAGELDELRYRCYTARVYP